MKTIVDAIKEHSLKIAIIYYSKPLYIADKQKIADSFDWKIFTDDYGAIRDSISGKVWVVYKVEGEWRHSIVC